METHIEQGKTAAFTWGTSLVIPFFFHVIAIIYCVESILYLSSEAADSGNRAWGRHGWHCMKKKLGLPHQPKQLICNVLSCNGASLAFDCAAHFHDSYVSFLRIFTAVAFDCSTHFLPIAFPFLHLFSFHTSNDAQSMLWSSLTMFSARVLCHQEMYFSAPSVVLELRWAWKNPTHNRMTFCDGKMQFITTIKKKTSIKLQAWSFGAASSIYEETMQWSVRRGTSNCQDLRKIWLPVGCWITIIFHVGVRITIHVPSFLVLGTAILMVRASVSTSWTRQGSPLPNKGVLAASTVACYMTINLYACIHFHHWSKDFISHLGLSVPIFLWMLSNVKPKHPMMQSAGESIFSPFL